MNQSEQINELALALSKVQGSISPAKKDSNNPFFKSKYADLTSVWDSCRQQLSLNQIAVVQTLDDTETHLVIVTTLMHSSGQWIKSKMMMEKVIADKVTKTDRKMNAQEIGASTTYLRRFSLAAIVGVCTEDDDGNSISGNSNKKIDAKMNEYQANELTYLLSRCGNDYKNTFYNHIKHSFNADSFFDVPSELFQTIKNDLTKIANDFENKKG